MFVSDAVLTAAKLDPILHRASIVQIAGDIYRLKDKRRAKLKVIWRNSEVRAPLKPALTR